MEGGPALAPLLIYKFQSQRLSLILPRMRHLVVWPWLLSASLLISCSPSNAPEEPPSSPSEEDDEELPPLPWCDVHAGATPRFTDRTDAWGLGRDGLAATGNRIMAADLDGDGYPDLVISSNMPNHRDAIDSGGGVRVLFNREGPSGGRIFVDGTRESGIFQTRDGSDSEYRAAHLAIAGDVNNDGHLDLFSGTYVDPTQPSATDTGDRSEILLNDGTGKFTLAPVSDISPGPKERWPTTSASFVDIDRDGILDIFVGFWYQRYGGSHLGVQAQAYKGHGDGTFSTITEAAGLLTDRRGFAEGTNHRPAYGVTACDLNDDGAPELLVSAYGRQWNLLYQNDGEGRFTEIGRESGFAGDANADFSDNEFFACYCTENASDPNCKDAKSPSIGCPSPAGSYWNAGVDDQKWRQNGNSFTTYCSDITGDGKLDLYTAEIAHWHIGKSSDNSELLVSEGEGSEISFRRPGNENTGLVFPRPTVDWNEGAVMVGGGDFDLDGREDLFVAATDYPDQYGLVFNQRADGTFEDKAEAWGIHHPCPNGLVIADFDRDGDLDILVGSSRMRDCGNIWATNEIRLYENNASEQASYLIIKLVGDGKTANRAGIGAKVSVKAGDRTIVKELGGGYGHMGMQHDTVLFFGLGACEAVDTIEVRWPDKQGTRQVFRHVEARRFIELRQGEGEVREVL